MKEISPLWGDKEGLIKIKKIAVLLN